MDRTRTLVAALAVASVLAASLAAPLAAGPLKGKVKKGVYHAPAGNFSLPMPPDIPGLASSLGLHTSESYAPDGAMGIVSFTDDFGSLFGICYQKAHPNSLPLLADTTKTYALLEEWVRQLAMPVVFAAGSPLSTLDRVQETRFAGAPAALGLVSIPGGSPMTVIANGVSRKLDSRRGLLVFVRDGYVYMLFNETLPTRMGIVDSTSTLVTSPDLDDVVRKRIEPFYATITFGPGTPAKK